VPRVGGYESYALYVVASATTPWRMYGS